MALCVFACPLWGSRSHMRQAESTCWLWSSRFAACGQEAAGDPCQPPLKGKCIVRAAVDGQRAKP